MAETLINVTSAYQKVQYIVEANWGAGGTPTTELGSLDANPTVKLGAQKFTGRGFVLPSAVSTGKEEISVPWSGPGTYEEFCAFIKSVVSDAQLAAVPSYSLQAGGLLIAGAVVDSWKVDGDPSGVKIDGTLFGKSYAVTSPAALSSPGTLTPILNKHVTIEIGTYTVVNAFKWGMSVAGLWGPNFFVGAATPGGVCQKLVDASFNISFEASSANLALLTEDEEQAVTITMSDGTDTITIEFNAVREEPEAFADNDGVYGYGIKYAIMNADTTAITVTPPT
jgi:hypothetical protein